MKIVLRREFAHVHLVVFFWEREHHYSIALRVIWCSFILPRLPGSLSSGLLHLILAVPIEQRRIVDSTLIEDWKYFFKKVDHCDGFFFLVSSWQTFSSSCERNSFQTSFSCTQSRAVNLRVSNEWIEHRRRRLLFQPSFFLPFLQLFHKILRHTRTRTYYTHTDRPTGIAIQLGTT